MQEDCQKEKDALKVLCQKEDLAKKKANIYARLLMDVALAKDMEKLAQRHQQRKDTLTELVEEKKQKNKTEAKS